MSKCTGCEHNQEKEENKDWLTNHSYPCSVCNEEQAVEPAELLAEDPANNKDYKLGV